MTLAADEATAVDHLDHKWLQPCGVSFLQSRFPIIILVPPDVFILAILRVVLQNALCASPDFLIQPSAGDICRQDKQNRRSNELRRQIVEDLFVRLREPPVIACHIDLVWHFVVPLEVLDPISDAEEFVE